MLKSETKAIDGINYKVTQLPFGKGKQLLVRIFKLLGPAVGQAIGGVDAAKPTIADIKTAAIGAALGEIAGRLSQQDLDFAIDMLAEYTEVQQPNGDDGGERWTRLKQDMEFHFAGEYVRMFAWLAFALQVNYLGFLNGRGGLSAVLAQIKARMPSRSPAPSTGPSGASSQPSGSASVSTS